MAQFNPTLTIDRWAAGGPGWPHRSEEVELLWLPLLGPTAFALLRRLDTLTAQGPTLVCLDELGATLGLRSQETGVRSVVRAIERLVTFRLARASTLSRLELRDPVPHLTPRQLRSLPSALRSVASTEARSDLLADAQRREARLRQLVATLTDLGASESEVLVRLERQGHPAEAIVRALEERRRRLVTQRASASA